MSQTARPARRALPRPRVVALSGPPSRSRATLGGAPAPAPRALPGRSGCPPNARVRVARLVPANPQTQGCPLLRAGPVPARPGPPCPGVLRGRRVACHLPRCGEPTRAPVQKPIPCSHVFELISKIFVFKICPLLLLLASALRPLTSLPMSFIHASAPAALAPVCGMLVGHGVSATSVSMGWVNVGLGEGNFLSCCGQVFWRFGMYASPCLVTMPQCVSQSA